MKQYDEIRKISTGKDHDYTNGCLLDFAYFEKNHRQIAAYLRKQKALDADSRVIQRIIFTGKIKSTVENTRAIIFFILKQSKETMLEFAKGATNMLQLHINGEINVKLSDTQLKKLKTAVKDKTGTTLRMSLKMLDGNNLPDEL